MPKKAFFLSAAGKIEEMRRYLLLFLAILTLFSLLFLSSNIENEERFVASVERILQEKESVSLLLGEQEDNYLKLDLLPAEFQGKTSTLLSEQFTRKAWEKTGGKIYKKTRENIKQENYEIDLTPLVREIMKEIGFPRKEAGVQTILLSESEGKTLRTVFSFANTFSLVASFLLSLLFLTLFLFERKKRGEKKITFRYLSLLFLFASTLFLTLSLLMLLSESPAFIILQQDFLSLALCFLFSSIIFFLAFATEGNKRSYLLFPGAALLSFLLLPLPTNILASVFFLLFIFHAKARGKEKEAASAF